MPNCLASVAGAVIQATGRTELEDGLCAGGQLKARNGLQRVRTIPWSGGGGAVRTQTPRGRPNSNLLRPAGLPDFKSKGPGSIPGSRGVRIWPRLGKQDFVCIGREAEFQALRARNTHFPPWGASNKNKTKQKNLLLL